MSKEGRTILDTKPSELFDYFLAICKILGEDTTKIRDVVKTSKAYYQADESTRNEMRPMQVLENRWYKSLAEGVPDYSIYAADQYIPDMWACWELYSSRYLRAIRYSRALLSKKSIVDDLGDINSVVDLGCGIGFTTAALAELFFRAKVTGTNLDMTAQMGFARTMGRQHNFNVVADIRKIDAPVDLVWASEYFEHFHSPIEHLIEVLDILQPRALLIANSFTVHSIGHFDNYLVGDTLTVTNKNISRLFNDVLRERQFVAIETNLRNNRPAYWKRQT